MAHIATEYSLIIHSYTYVEQQVQSPILLPDRSEHLAYILLGYHIANADLAHCPLSARIRGRLELRLASPAEHKHKLLGVGCRGVGVRERDGAGTADTARSAGDEDDSLVGHF